eukprot:XP_001705554.1 Hypothetical protein GL50803_117312 [Giardia lamblia ATCC 50803]
MAAGEEILESTTDVHMVNWWFFSLADRTLACNGYLHDACLTGPIEASAY